MAPASATPGVTSGGSRWNRRRARSSGLRRRSDRLLSCREAPRVGVEHLEVGSGSHATQTTAVTTAMETHIEVFRVR